LLTFGHDRLCSEGPVIRNYSTVLQRARVNSKPVPNTNRFRDTASGSAPRAWPHDAFLRSPKDSADVSAYLNLAWIRAGIGGVQKGPVSQQPERSCICWASCVAKRYCANDSTGDTFEQCRRLRQSLHRRSGTRPSKWRRSSQPGVCCCGTCVLRPADNQLTAACPRGSPDLLPK
jgi:hypothetical protein